MNVGLEFGHFLMSLPPEANPEGWPKAVLKAEGGFEGRSPRAEGRKKAEFRNPKTET